MDRLITHIGLVMDGNRRFAKRKGMPSLWGHQKGAEKLRTSLKWLRELRVHEATFYTFSMQNFQRTTEEVSYLFAIFEKEFSKFIKDPSELQKNQVRIRFVGRLHLFPQTLQEIMHKLMNLTSTYAQYTINFAIGYGGREEIVDGVKKAIEAVQQKKQEINDITEETFAQFLYVSSEPDLVIRTGGDIRTSNFLPWQTIYSEWFFLPKTWPELEKKDIEECIATFQNRERRIGK